MEHRQVVGTVCSSCILAKETILTRLSDIRGKTSGVIASARFFSLPRDDFQSRLPCQRQLCRILLKFAPRKSQERIAQEAEDKGNI